MPGFLIILFLVCKAMRKIVVMFLMMLSLIYSDTMAQPCQASFTYTVVGHTAYFVNTSGSDSASSLMFHWNFGVMSATSNSNNPSYTYSSAGTYTVCLFITDTACHSNPSMSYCTEVTVDTTIIPPPPPVDPPVSSSNVITPNGDGKDDEVQLSISGNEIKIYNRFGILVRTLKDPRKNIWDATDDSGAIVPMGHYVAINEENNTSTHISVIR